MDEILMFPLKLFSVFSKTVRANLFQFFFNAVLADWYANELKKNILSVVFKRILIEIHKIV